MRTNRWLIGLLVAASTYAALYFSMGPRHHGHHGWCGSDHCGSHDEKAGADQHGNAAEPWGEGSERTN